MSDKPEPSADDLPAQLSPRIAQLRLRDLLLLDQIAATGSLRGAAQLLHVTQPAVTQALQSLERAFGVALVERGARGVRLTPAGEAALSRLRAARHELLAAQAAAHSPHHSTLRLGTLPVASLSLLPRALARIHAQQPRARVRLVESTVSELWRQLAQGELDAIVCRFPNLMEGQALPAGVRCVSIGHESLVLVARTGHPALRRRAAAPTLAELARLDWVLPPQGSLTRLVFDGLFTRAGLAPPDATVTSISFHTNLHLAAASDLLAVAPESAVQCYAGTLRLKRIAAPWAGQVDDIVLAWRESGAELPALVALRDNLVPDESPTTPQPF